ncbi:MAG: uroporphyrinogen decarboxylase family protein [bacterium]
MNGRERYLAVMKFQDADRYPYYELGIWGQTYERWLKEGLDEEELRGDWFRGEPKFAKLDRREYIRLDMKPIPGFERTLEETDRYVIFIDRFGRKRRGLKEGEARGTRLSMDTYIDFFVKNRDDFLEMKKHYDPSEPSRYPQNWEDLKREWEGRDYPLYLTENCGFAGLYWNLREMMGTENLSYAFYDQPKLIHEILDFMVEFFMRVAEKALKEVEVDVCILNEDFAYKSGPLISPKIFREFFLPRYKRIVEFLRKYGVRVIELDSDGNTEVLIPLLIEAGIDCHWPLEAAAGMNPVEIRKRYGKDLALIGGIDKRELAKDKKAIEEELRRKIVPMLEMGGYIPTVDHTVPPDVPLENFLYYLELKREISEGGWG